MTDTIAADPATLQAELRQAQAGAAAGRAAPPKANLGMMRELNEQIVLDLLRQEGEISRAELARRSRLSRSTVSSIVAALLGLGLVRETGSGSSQGGRRPIMIAFNYQSSYVIGVEIGGATATGLLADLAAVVLRRAQRPIDIAAGPAACAGQVAALVNELLGDALVARDLVLGIGVGLPGALAFAPGWHGAPLQGLLEEALGLRVAVETDANLGALAEQRWGAARDQPNVIYLYLGGAGIGCGLILDSRLYRGERGLAGTIGHLRVAEHGPACRCGTPGCLESVVGTPALLARARAQGLACERIEDLLQLAQQGSRAAAALIEAAGAHLGAAVATLLTIINPGQVVIGGTLAAAGARLLQAIQAALPAPHAQAAGPATLVPGALGSDVVALGGVAAIIGQALDAPVALPRGAPIALGKE